MKRLVTKAINPLKFFISDSRAIGVLLLLCTGFSLLMSNTISGESIITDGPRCFARSD